jgi:hypothetical protein
MLVDMYNNNITTYHLIYILAPIALSLALMYSVGPVNKTLLNVEASLPLSLPLSTSSTPPPARLLTACTKSTQL